MNIVSLDALITDLADIADEFAAKGHRLYLVGGVVRDALLNETQPAAKIASWADVDLTTDARPDTIKHILKQRADALWTQGEKFGTIGARIGKHDIEITTHRREVYDEQSRKPIVTFGDKLDDDLSRRDFTVNAMAVELPGRELRDPYEGRSHLSDSLLRTPLEAEISFGDDPLRMLRAARFIARFGFEADLAIVEAATTLASRLSIVSVERVTSELEGLFKVSNPAAGFEFLANTGLLRLISAGTAEATDTMLDLAKTLGSVDESLTQRRAGFFWATLNLGAHGFDRLNASQTATVKESIKGQLKAVFRAHRYSKDIVDETTALIIGAVEVLSQEMSSATVRKIVHDIGYNHFLGLKRFVPQICRHDARFCTDTYMSRFAYFEEIFGELDSSEDLSDFSPALSGEQIMKHLNLTPGPYVGDANRFLLEFRLKNGPLTSVEAAELLKKWWKSHNKLC